MDSDIRDRAYEQRVSAETLRRNGRDVDLCRRFLAHLELGLNGLEPKATYQEPFDIVLLLGAMAYNSLRWSLELLQCGYYVPSNATTRVAWECWLHTQYLIFYPERLASWREHRRNRRVIDLREAVAEAWTAQPEERAEALGALNDLYDRLSTYSHPNPQALALLLEEEPSGGAKLRLGPAYDESLVIETVHLFCYTTGNVFVMPTVLLSASATEYDAQSEVLKAELEAWRNTVLERAENGGVA